MTLLGQYWLPFKSILLNRRITPHPCINNNAVRTRKGKSVGEPGNNEKKINKKNNDASRGGLFAFEVYRDVDIDATIVV